MAEATRVTLVGWPGRGSQLLQAGIELQQSLQAAASAIAPELKAKAIDESPTGKTPHPGLRFREGWVTQVQAAYAGGASVTLGNVSPVAPFVLNDTRPHVIWANHLLGHSQAGSGARPLGGVGGGLGFLRFMGSGGPVFRHMVHHPGTKANRIGERVDTAMQPRYQEILRERAEGFVVRLQSIFS